MGKPDFTLNSNYNEKASFRSLRFGANAPVLETELNELQDIINGRQTDLIKNVFGDGVMGVGEYLVNNTQFTLSNEIVLLNGELLHVAPTTITVAEGNNVFVNMWYEDILATSTVKEWGNKQSVNNVQNKLIDPRLGFETSRRVQVVFQLATTEKSGAFNLKIGTVSGGKFIKTCNILKSPMSETLKGEYVTCTNTTIGDLLDVKIYGNTVQNPSNLADIKSVGKDNGDGTYKLVVGACSENLFDGKFKKDTAINNNPNDVNNNYGKDYTSVGFQSSESYTRVEPSTTYKYSSKSSDSNFNVMVFYYDANYNTISWETKWLEFTTPNNARYVRFYVPDKYAQPDVMLVKGATKPPFVPYEGILNNLKLPCPLEKWDYIYFDEKENAWCIYKGTYHYNDKDRTRLMTSSLTNVYRFAVNLNNNINNLIEGLSTKLLYNKNYTLDEEHFYSHKDSGVSQLWLFVNKPTIDALEGKTLEEKCLNYFNNEIDIIVPLDSPYKIVLPKQAQIDLNSFFGVTHAWVDGGEVNGEIEITFPKSLMSSVEANTKAIDKIQDDIKDIDSIRESQDYNYTTNTGDNFCEETKTGVSRNVKIYGNNLNNIFTYDGLKLSQYITLTGNKLKWDVTNQSWLYVSKPITNIKPNTLYTLICDIGENTLNNDFILMDSSLSNRIPTKNVILPVGSKNRKVVTTFISKNSELANEFNAQCQANTTGIIEINDIMIIEGNLLDKFPQNYIKGINNVGNGQPLALLSRKEDNIFNPYQEVGFDKANWLYDGSQFNIDSNQNYLSNWYWVKVKPNTRYYVKAELDAWIRFYKGRTTSHGDGTHQLCSLDTNRRSNTFVTDSSGWITVRLTCETKQGVSYIKDLIISQKDINYVPYEEDVKPLLVKENGVWKPLTNLRGINDTFCDVVDSDYVERKFDEITLDETLNYNIWSPNPSATKTLIFYLTGGIPVKMRGQYIPITNMLSTRIGIAKEKIADFKDMDKEGIGYWDNNVKLFVSINKSRLETPDVNGFKKLLKSWKDSGVPLTVVYEKNEYTKEDISPTGVTSFEGSTLVSLVNSYIPTRLDFSLTSNLGNLVKENGIRTDNLEDMSANMLLELAMKADLMHRHMNVTSQADGFMSKEDKTKLDGIQANANNYIHPNTPEIRHVTDAEKASWNAKPTTTDVENRIKAIVGASPESLDTLKELADALNNDPNFATNIINQLGNKADKVHNHDDRYYTEAESDTRFFANNLANMDAGSDFNNATTQGKYTVSSSTSLANAPFTGYVYGTLMVYVRSYGGIVQDFVSTGNIRYQRIYDSTNKVWSDWCKIFATNAKPTWDDVTGRPSVYPPSTHTHDDRYYTESESDGRYLQTNKGTVTDFNTATSWGIYRVASATTLPNAPYTGGIYGNIEVFEYNQGTETIQRFTDYRNDLYIRFKNNNNGGTWLAWSKVFTSTNKPTWDDVTNKPSTFTPASHNHDDRYFTESEADGRFFRTYMGTITSASDFSTTKAEGEYIVSSGTTIPNAPYAGGIYGILFCYQRGSDGVVQEFVNNEGGTWKRYFTTNSNTWSPWNKHFSTTNKPNWDDVADKPTTIQMCKLTNDNSSCRNITGQDLNTITQAGFYDGERMTNAPTVAWYYIEVFRHSNSDGYILQRATTLSGSIPSLYERTRVGGTWSAWVQVLNKTESDARYTYQSDFDNDLKTLSVSEDLTNNSKKSFKVGTGVNGSNTLDYSNRMKKSVVNINGILGNTQKTTKGNLYPILLNMVSSSEPPINVLSQKVVSNEKCTYTNSNGVLTVTSVDASWGCVQFEVPVTPNSTYMLDYKFNETTGNMWVAVSTSSVISDTGYNIMDIDYWDNGKENIFEVGNVNKIYIRFYSNVFISVGGVTTSYSDVNLIKVNGVLKTDKHLRGLPNGVCDAFYNGRIIKRVERFDLTDLLDWELIDTAKPNTNAFMCKLPNTVNSVDKTKVCLNANRYKAVSDMTLASSDEICFSMGGTQGHLIFRVRKGLNTVEKLKQHLSLNETGLYVEAEIYPKVEHVHNALVCNPGDTIYIGTYNHTVNCSHTVQLNTKSQIDSVMDLIKDNGYGDIDLSKVVTLKNYKKGNVGKTYYTVFPDGTCVQWGIYNVTFSGASTASGFVTYPITFTGKQSLCVGSVASSSQGGFSEYMCSVLDDTEFQARIEVGKYNRQSLSNVTIQVNWIALGRVEL